MTWETATVRARTWARTLVRLAGLLLVLAGAYHLFAPYVAPTLPQWAPWRVVGLTVASPEAGAVYVGDVVVVAVGAVVAWVV